MSEVAREGVDERAAVGVADGSLTGEQRARAQAQLGASPAGRRALEQQQRVVGVLRAAAPVTPPGLRAAVHARTARRGRVRFGLLGRPALAGGVAVALVALVLLGGVLALNPLRTSDESSGGGSLSRGATVMAALAFGSRPATAPAPAPLAARPQLLARAVEGVAFPNWARARVMPAPPFGWTPTGARRDRLDGRASETVFYEHPTHRIAYTIIAGVEHLIELSKLLQARGVDLVVLDQGIDTSTAVGRMFFEILGAIAEFAHALMSERTMDGLAAARGRTGGQKPKLGPRQVKLARHMYNETGDDGKRKHTVAEIAAEFGVNRPTIYRHLAKTADLAQPAA